MTDFDPARARLLLKDVHRTTRGHMAGFKVELERDEQRLRITGQRIAIVRLGAWLALKALSSSENARYEDDAIVPGVLSAALEIDFVDPLPKQTQQRREGSPFPWHVFVAGLILGGLLSFLFLMLGVILR